jgi:UDP-glucose 4-epimerase
MERKMKNNANEFAGEKIIITGGLGFIGANLAQRLVESGAIVTLIDSLNPVYGGNYFNVNEIKDRLHINISDVRDASSMAYLVQDKDYIFNLAGQTSHLDSMRDPFTDLQINCVAQLSILEACRKNNPHVKIIYAGTRQIYGKPMYLPVDEKHLLQPTDVNGINKMAGEWYHILYNNVYGIKTVSLRLTNTYGPRMRVRDDRQTFLGIWIKRLIEREPLQIYGDGRQVRDFNYIDDVVDALLSAALAEKANGCIYNLGSSEVINLKDLAVLMIAVNGSGSYEMIPFPGERKKIDIGDYYSDYSYIQKELDWRPKVDLKEGLGKTINFYKKNRNNYW